MLAWISSVLASPTFWTSAVLLATVLFLLYWRATSGYRRWAERGIPIIEPPSFPFGNLGPMYTGSSTDKILARELYNKAGSNRFGVLFDGLTGVVFLQDLELVKQFLITDFWHFSDFGFGDKEFSKAPQNDFGLGSKSGRDWRALKSCVTPAFSLSNLKDISLKVSHFGTICTPDCRLHEPIYRSRARQRNRWIILTICTQTDQRRFRFTVCAVASHWTALVRSPAASTSRSAFI